jgi:hypothetical protein
MILSSAKRPQAGLLPTERTNPVAMKTAVGNAGTAT